MHECIEFEQDAQMAPKHSHLPCLQTPSECQWNPDRPKETQRWT